MVLQEVDVLGLEVGVLDPVVDELGLEVAGTVVAEACVATVVVVADDAVVVVATVVVDVGGEVVAAVEVEKLALG